MLYVARAALDPGFGAIDIEVRWPDIEVAGYNNGNVLLDKDSRPLSDPPCAPSSVGNTYWSPFSVLSVAGPSTPFSDVAPRFIQFDNRAASPAR
jgi:hypothetical protein